MKLPCTRTRCVVSLSLACVVLLLGACSSAETPATETFEVATPSIVVESITTKFGKGAHAGDLSCEDCHSSETGTSDEALSRAVQELSENQDYESITLLCLSCHLTLKGDTPNSANVHLAHQSSECADCHDVHSATASCTQSGCHSAVKSTISAEVSVPEGHSPTGNENAFMCGGTECHAAAARVATAPVYHQPVHRDVECYACHDASGMDIVLTEGGRWTTSVPSEQETLQVSHMLQTPVDCAKCHNS